MVDGVVERDLDKKELRLLTSLNEEEKQIAAAICVAFKQNVILHHPSTLSRDDDADEYSV